ncbi:hypothetical protein ACJ2A9_11845 [Anaerobacillus sp. MEB173]|uniref:hypothetical protein n=1 Tax=Anaerobacillus sp. MEB173 TaxID=3383345 RepID=UPI003F8ECB88
MKGYTKILIVLSIIYLVIGTFLGTLFFFEPSLMKLKPVHVHLNLLGFMSMMIYGVLYHVLPRFIGVPLHSEKMAWFHLYAGNISLILLLIAMALFYTGTMNGAFDWAKWVALGHWLTIVVFAYNIFRTVRSASKK